MEEIMGKDVMIQRRKPGTGELAEYSTIVKCHLIGYFYSSEKQERISEEPFEKLYNQSFQIGEGDTIPALELALRHSKEHEELTVFCSSRFAFGFQGRNYKTNETEKKGEDGSSSTMIIAIQNSNVAVIPPNTDLEYEIIVVSHRTERDFDAEFIKNHQKEFEQLNENDDGMDGKNNKEPLLNRMLTLQSLLLRKEAGNRWFSYGDYSRAAKSYSRATQLSEGYFSTSTPNIQGLDPSDEEGKKELEEKLRDAEAKKNEKIPVEDVEIVNIYVSCLNNLAACKLAQREYLQAKDLCTKVLEFSPFNTKALLRAAKASLATDSYEECELCLKRLLEIDTLEPAVKTAAKSEYAKLRKAQAVYKEKTKEIQKKIADKLFNQKQQEAARKAAAAEEKANNNQPYEEQSTTVTGKSEGEQSQTEGTKNVEEAGKTIESFNKGKPNNMVVLLGTSMLVIFFSLVLAFLKRSSSNGTP